MTQRKKPVLAIDFDGTLRIDEKTPTPGALDSVREYLKHFDVNVYAARSARPGGPEEMRDWLKRHGFPVARMKFPTGKPKIQALIDDQAIQFRGEWPSVSEIKNMSSWSEPVKCFSCGGRGWVCRGRKSNNPDIGI